LSGILRWAAKFLPCELLALLKLLRHRIGVAAYRQTV
jgi:hypothetical protein